MEQIRVALSKARTSLDQPQDNPDRTAAAGLDLAVPAEEVPASVTPLWQPRQVHLDDEVLEANRIVSYAMDDERHVAFNLLRTRVRKALHDNNWRSIAVTSPTPNCGKTMVGLNLAFALARSPECRTVMIDLDLKRPAVAKTLGIQPTGSIGQFLNNGANLEDCFVQVGENLTIGVNNDRYRHSSELVLSARMDKLLEFVHTTFDPDVVLFDLPPMQTCDDALSFLPRIDAALLVVAAGATTAQEVDECEQQIGVLEKLLGIVLNKSDSPTEDYYY